MFRHTTQIRRWAVRVLLLWLFGVFSSIAHACLVTESAPAAGVVHRHASPLAEATADCHGAGDVGDAAQLSCQAFCDKASMSIPPVKTGPDDGASDVAPALPPTSVVLPAATAPVQSWVPRRDGARPRPIAIAFLRLTR